MYQHKYYFEHYPVAHAKLSTSLETDRDREREIEREREVDRLRKCVIKM